MSNVFNQNTKQLIIFPFGTTGNEMELGVTSWEKRKSNDIGSFVRPNQEDPERRANNFNQVEENHIFNTLVSDEFISKAEFMPDGVTTKEELETQMDEYFESQRLVEVQYGHIQERGYITEYNVDEAANEDNSVFRINFTLLVCVPMSSA